MSDDYMQNDAVRSAADDRINDCIHRVRHTWHRQNAQHICQTVNQHSISTRYWLQ